MNEDVRAMQPRDLSAFPRVALAQLPTPLTALPRLSAHLGGPTLYVKRDDCTGLATGGNKARKLEFLLGDALRSGADTVITCGATQSNHARQTAAAAAALGLACELVLQDRLETGDIEYNASANVLIDRLCGATIHAVGRRDDVMQAMERRRLELEAQGRKAYVIPTGGSTPVGSLGYVAAAGELLQQARASSLHIDRIVHAGSSSGTQAGLLTGLALAREDIPVLAFSVGLPRQEQEDRVFSLACQTAALLGITAIHRDRVVANSDFVGAGYARPTPEMVEAVRLVARLEGLLLDPVYTGKAMAGLLHLIEQRQLVSGMHVVFLHTGGSTALNAYRSVFDR